MYVSHVEPRIILLYSKTHTVFYFSILQRCYVLLEDFHLSSIAKGAWEECNITFVMHVTGEWDKRRNISPSLVHTDLWHLRHGSGALKGLAVNTSTNQ